MKYVCQVCGYIYDDEKEAVPFDQLPDDWRCPLCRAPKSEFRPQEEKRTIAAEKPASRPAVPADPDLRRLSAGQLAAVFANLSRAAEKQNKEGAAQLFSELEAYFADITPEPQGAGVEELSQMLKADISDYPRLRAVADADADRGAARALVWGEKVTRMLSSLVDRYLAEGEALTADTEVWVCTACGFVYIGQTPPEQCPVCKVPDWKFEKIEGRART